MYRPRDKNQLALDMSHPPIGLVYICGQDPERVGSANFKIGESGTLKNLKQRLAYHARCGYTWSISIDAEQHLNLEAAIKLQLKDHLVTGTEYFRPDLEACRDAFLWWDKIVRNHPNRVSHEQGRRELRAHLETAAVWYAKQRGPYGINFPA